MRPPANACARSRAVPAPSNARCDCRSRTTIGPDRAAVGSLSQEKRGASSGRRPARVRLLLVAGRPDALPRILYGVGVGDAFHRGLVRRVDFLGVELELFLAVR